MWYLFIIIGIFIGLLLSQFIFGKYVGIIEVDHNTKLCRIKITSADLENKHCKKVIFRVEHTADIRVENTDYNGE